MGKKAGKAETDAKKESEGEMLLGLPKFKDIGNGRFKCVETGHELPAHSRDSYSLTKHCRLGLIDSALSKNKPPLNMFRQDPNSRSKLICKLTGDIINKNEEHIWKHINGKRFLNSLEQKEVEQQTPNQLNEKKDTKTESVKKKKKKKMKKIQEKDKVERESSEPEEKGKGSAPEDDIDFWIPPVGDRWDNDDGGDRWGSDTEDDDSADGLEEGEPDVDKHDSEVSTRKKRTSQETGGSSSPSRKKVKNKKTSEGSVEENSSELQSTTTTS